MTKVPVEVASGVHLETGCRTTVCFRYLHDEAAHAIIFFAIEKEGGEYCECSIHTTAFSRESAHVDPDKLQLRVTPGDQSQELRIVLDGIGPQIAEARMRCDYEPCNGTPCLMRE